MRRPGFVPSKAPNVLKNASLVAHICAKVMILLIWHRFGTDWISSGVSKNCGTPKSSILIGFSIINHPFWEYPYFFETPISSGVSNGCRSVKRKFVSSIKLSTELFSCNCIVNHCGALRICCEVLIPLPSWLNQQLLIKESQMDAFIFSHLFA